MAMIMFRQTARTLSALLLGCACLFTTVSATAAEEQKTHMIAQRADPWVLRHTDGYYYFIATVPEYDRIELRRARTIAGLVTLSEPTLDWETRGYKVNEGAAVLKRNGRIFISYSASATDHNYAMGLLWADADADPMKPDSWHKVQQPVFATNTDLERFGPGHNSFTVAEDGETDLMIYHARDYLELQGNPLTDPNRHTRVRALHWDKNGMPDFRQNERDWCRT